MDGEVIRLNFNKKFIIYSGTIYFFFLPTESIEANNNMEQAYFRWLIVVINIDIFTTTFTYECFFSTCIILFLVTEDHNNVHWKE